MDPTRKEIKRRYRIAEDVYLSLQGVLCDPLPNVENAFHENSVCDKSYSEMRRAYERLCTRLGVQGEDADIEIIIGSLQTIADELCYRMFAYGAELGKKDS